jgi:hypothetical protein
MWHLLTTVHMRHQTSRALHAVARGEHLIDALHSVRRAEMRRMHNGFRRLSLRMPAFAAQERVELEDWRSG